MTPPHADAEVPAPDNRTDMKTLTFEWFRYEYADGLEQSGDREVFDARHPFTAQIVQPEPGRVLQGSVLFWRHQHEGQPYAIMRCKDAYFAVRTDVQLMPNLRYRFEMRPVVLDQPNQPMAWEVFVGSDHYGWEPVEAQHVEPRTLPSEQWLDVIEHEILPELLAEEKRGATTRLDLEAAQRTIAPSDHSLRHQLERVQLEDKRIAGRILKAQELAAYLRSRRGTLVTLHQCIIKGRAQSLPTIPADNKPSPRIAPLPRMRP